jgi:hypothetical protein
MPSLPQPNGRCCIIRNPAGQQVSKCEVPGLSQAAILAARNGADEAATQQGYTGARDYVESAVHI